MKTREPAPCGSQALATKLTYDEVVQALKHLREEFASLSINGIHVTCTLWKVIALFLSCLVTPSVKAEGASWWHFLAFVRTSEQDERAESQAMSCW